MLFSFARRCALITAIAAPIPPLDFAQTSPSISQPSSLAVHSPEVSSDGRVTFRIVAPIAQTVRVHVDAFKDPMPLQKGDDGVWTFTSDKLQPDLYGYWFEVDGVHLLDPLNTEIKPNLLTLSNVVHVSGANPQAWEDSNILHGAVHHHLYHSAIVGDDRDFYVYTPPGYNGAEAKQYPVLYLLHGYSDDASGWSAVGKANLILDTLIASGKAKPMLIVMPLGYGAPAIVQRTPSPSTGFNNTELRQRNFDRFRQALMDEVMPAVEKAYRVNSSRDARAIAGLSMGGAETLLTGLNRLDSFSYIGSFSAGGLGSDYTQAFPQLKESANSQLHLLWIACGTEDRLIMPNREIIAWLKGKGIKVTAVETPGMHTWMVWRRNLIAFAPLLFQDSQTASTQ